MSDLFLIWLSPLLVYFVCIVILPYCLFDRTHVPSMLYRYSFKKCHETAASYGATMAAP